MDDTLLATVPRRAGKYRRSVTVELADGKMTIPVHLARGRNDGPVVLFAAGEHGHEINGVAAIDRLFQELSCADLCGTLVTVPVINPGNVQARNLARGEGWDTCYGWPGFAQGTPAERITAALSAAVVDAADVVINIHAWSWYASSCAFASPQDPRAVRLARAFGLPFVDFGFPRYTRGPDAPLHPRHNMLTHYATARGKSAVLIELRTHHWQFPDSVNAGMQGLRNVLVCLRLLPGRVRPPATQLETTGKEEFAYASRPGLYMPLKDIADRVRKGDTLGYLLDLQSGRRTAVKSPCTGGVWLNSRVGPGEATLPDMHALADRGDLLALIKHIKA
jgi:uncharacterized protein